MKSIDARETIVCFQRRKLYASRFLLTNLFAVFIFLSSTHVVIGGTIISPWQNLVTDIADQLSEAYSLASQQKDDRLSVTQSDYASLGRFVDKDAPFGALLINDYPDKHAKFWMAYRFPEGEAQPEVYFIGQRRLVAIVNRGNRVSQLTVGQISKLLSSNDKAHMTKWSIVGGSAVPVAVYDQGQDSWGREQLRLKCMGYSEQHPDSTTLGFYPFREDIRPLLDGNNIIQRVRDEPIAIGFFMYQGQDLTGVKVVNIVPDDQTKPVPLSQTPKIQHDYFLSEPLMLYVHPKAPEVLRDFGRFAVSPAGAKIAAEHGLVTPYHEWLYQASQRVEEARLGQGERLTAISIRSLSDLLPDLVTEHVRANEVVRLSPATMDADVSAMGAFLAPGSSRELLFLTGRPSDRAFEVHGQRWNELQPAEHLLAGRATAIVVNAANKLDSLTLGQIQAIFRGEVNDWSIVGGTGFATNTDAKNNANLPTQGVTINRIGLRQNHAGVQPFYEDGVSAADLRRVTYAADTAEALAAVSVDPQAIAFVDLAAIPTTGQTVKVLGIQLGMGDRAQIVKPTPQSLRDAMYPFTQRVYMYVHPQASETAKNFAQFLATCGESASKPYTDTVKDVMMAYQKHGLIPLAEPAIQRMLKDEQAALAARADAVVSPASKRR